jgi:dihydrolipoamide dehydrogenase
MREDYFAVVIGGGPGGTPAAMELAANGKKTLLIEASGKLGGACLFVGCIPSKIIKFTADEAAAFEKSAAKFGLSGKPDRTQAWTMIQKKMDQILNGRSSKALEKARSMPSLTVVSGKAAFAGPRLLEVTKDDGQKLEVGFEKAIIATGAHSVVPPFAGNAIGELLVTENFFRMPKLPTSMIIIGGGPIGIELAQMLGSLGVRVTIVEVMDALLKGLAETDFSQAVHEALEKAGIRVLVSTQVKSVDKGSKGLVVAIQGSSGATEVLEAEKVLVAAGKAPNVEGLNLEAASVEFSRKGIVIDDYMETTAPGIYAAGDVNTGPKFAHIASHEAHIVAVNMLKGNSLKENFDKNAWVLFSEPEIASAGLLEEQARSRGLDVFSGTYAYQIDATAQIQESLGGKLRFVAERGTLRLVGVHVLGRDASEVIGEGSLAVSAGLTLADLVAAVHPHPTLTEAFGFLASDMLAKSRR